MCISSDIYYMDIHIFQIYIHLRYDRKLLMWTAYRSMLFLYSNAFVLTHMYLPIKGITWKSEHFES